MLTAGMPVGFTVPVPGRTGPRSRGNVPSARLLVQTGLCRFPSSKHGPDPGDDRKTVDSREILCTVPPRVNCSMACGLRKVPGRRETPLTLRNRLAVAVVEGSVSFQCTEAGPPGDRISRTGTRVSSGMVPNEPAAPHAGRRVTHELKRPAPCSRWSVVESGSGYRKKQVPLQFRLQRNLPAEAEVSVWQMVLPGGNRAVAAVPAGALLSAGAVRSP